MKRSLGLLVAGGLAFWLVIVYPARLLWGDTAAVFSAVATLLSLIPACATLAWSRWSFHSTPEQQLLALLGGTSVRMAFVVGVGLILFCALDYFHEQSFLIWLVVFYLVTLALEMCVLLIGRSASEPTQYHG